MHPSLVNSPFSTMHNHPSRPSTFDPFPGLAATSITAAKPSSLIRLLEAFKAAATMHQARPHVLSGWCEWSLARDPDIIAAVQDVVGAGCSVFRGGASVMHNQLVFWCLYAELWAHSPRGWSAWRSPYHCPPHSSIAYGLQLSLHRPSRQQSHPETEYRFFPDASPWFALTCSDHVDSRAGHWRRRRGLLDDTGLSPLLLSPSRRWWWRKGALGSPIDDRCQLGLAHGKDIGLRIKSKAHFQPLSHFQSLLLLLLIQLP